MLKLQKLRAEFASPLSSKKNSKHIRISFGSMVKGTKKPAKIVTDKTIQWDDPIILPIQFNKKLAFEIYDKHEFGYNPEELDKVLEGTIVIQLKDSKGSWEIFSGRQSVGYLSASIKSKIPNMIAELVEEDEDQVTNTLKIKSIVGHFPFARFKKAYVKIKLGGKIIKTSQIKSRKGEIVYIEPIKIEKPSKDTEAKIQVFSVDDERQMLIGEGVFYLIGKKPPKKVVMHKDNLEEVGEVFIQSKVISKKDKNQLNLQSSSKSLKLDESLQVSNYESKTYDEDQTTSKISRASRKDLSVLYRNHNISFGKEERFKLYGEKQNQRVTYLQERNFDFKSPNQKKQYRGASFGFGQKVDLSKQKRKNNAPGVGRYKLPSIWDRY